MTLLPAALTLALSLALVSPSLPAGSPARLIVHRGLSAQAPENTRPAIELAGAYGLYGCEFDVFCSADGVWVLSHDRTADAMTDGTGAIPELTWAELSAFTVDSGANAEDYPGLGLCTLSEALDVCAEWDLVPFIEVKTGTWSQLDDLVDLIREKGLLERAVILSYGYDILQYLRTGGDVIPLYLLVGGMDDDAIQKAAALPNTGLDFLAGHPDNHPQRVAQAQAAGLPLIAWVADTQTEADRLIRLGVTQLTTNRLIPCQFLP